MRPPAPRQPPGVRALLAALACTAGCSTPQVDPGCPAPEPALPVVTSDALEPPWTADEVAAEVRATLDRKWPTPVLLGERFEWFLAQGDGECPPFDAELFHLPSVEGCVSDTGYFYQGVGDTIESSTTDDGQVRYSFTHYGDFSFANPEGLRYRGGGGASYAAVFRDDTVEFHYQIAGSWQEEGREDWLGDGVSALLRMDGDGSSGRKRVTMDGEASIGDHVLEFEDLQFETNGACAPQPTGVLRVRAPNGGWYGIDFNAGCGRPCVPLDFNGTPLGEVCLDLAQEIHIIFEELSPDVVDTPVAAGL